VSVGGPYTEMDFTLNDVTEIEDESIKIPEEQEKMGTTWYENPNKYSYVRKGKFFCSNKNYKPFKGIEGISIIGIFYPHIIDGIIEGTVYYIKSTDFTGYIPTEAVKIVP
jgi:hypothetical protein